MGGREMRRVTIFLPVGTDEEVLAASAVREWLLHEVGATMSLIEPPAFEGWWQSDERGWVLDIISLLIIDVPFSVEEISQFVRFLSAEISYRYIIAGSTQDELGISVSDLLL